MAPRALDTGERLLKLVGARTDADRVKAIRLNLRRLTADKDDKKVLKAAAHWLSGCLADSATMETLRPAKQRPRSDSPSIGCHRSGRADMCLWGTLWGLYRQYPYMPRLRDRRVLEAGHPEVRLRRVPRGLN